MADSKARLEGLARAQLSNGRGAESVMQDLIRLGPVDRESARQVVDRVWPEIRDRYFRRLRRSSLLGFLLLGIPATFFAVPYIALFLFPETSTVPSIAELISLFILIPFISIPAVFGTAFLLYGRSGMKRAKAQTSPGLAGSLESGPVRTGLAWRAGPFEWK